MNKQNFTIWESENPQATLGKEMRPQGVTVWCGFWYGGVIGPFLFENDQRGGVTINSERYYAMLNKFLFSILTYLL